MRINGQAVISQLCCVKLRRFKVRSAGMSAAEAVEIETGSGEVLGSVIWLHGLGADGHDFEPIVPELRLPEELRLRFVFPHAPVQAVTLNGGMAMRAWFDILTLDRGGPEDEAGIRASAAILDQLIAREQERGIAANKIVVAGFSQGGAIALHAGLRSKQPLGGVMALSTYLPVKSAFADEVLTSELPIFMAHGSLDPILPMILGRNSADLLVANGFNVEWHDYQMAHSVCAEEIDDIRTWLLSIYATE
jgi:phospholipase/carboxylesterase